MTPSGSTRSANGRIGALLSVPAAGVRRRRPRRASPAPNGTPTAAGRPARPRPVPMLTGAAAARSRRYRAGRSCAGATVAADVGGGGDDRESPSRHDDRRASGDGGCRSVVEGVDARRGSTSWAYQKSSRRSSYSHVAASWPRLPLIRQRSLDLALGDPCWPPDTDVPCSVTTSRSSRSSFASASRRHAELVAGSA